MADESWPRIVAVHLTAYFVIGQRVARLMIEDGPGGVILFTSSIASLGAPPRLSHYGITKATVANLAQTAAI